ncbi:hypothetical protein H0O02_05160 [Candidatus Micrarchaeota archaeon]|nr:hypothetical protein [Candidatus Micrarchaeota archaeon]
MSKKGELEINEMFITLLLLIGIMTAVWVAGGSVFSEQTQVQVTDKSVGGLIDENLALVSEDFYTNNPQGDYRIDVQEWSLGPMGQPPDYVPNSENMSIPGYPVLFGDRYLYEIRGFGAKVYERTDQEQPIDIECFAVFLGKSDTLDGYYANQGTFEIKFYTHYTERKLLESCQVYAYKDAVTKGGNLIRTYYMHCNVIWGGYF